MAELDYTAIAASSINTPASGVVASFVDLSSKRPMWKTDDGAYQGSLSNQSASTQTGFAADTYLTGSNISSMPNGMFRVGTYYHLLCDITKTAAGTATPIFTVRIGTAGSTSDTARLTFTFAAGTAAIDTGILEIHAYFRTVGSGTSAVMTGAARIIHHLAATGITSTGASGTGIILVTSSGFDSTTSNSVIGTSVNGGTSASWTITMVRAELINL